MYYVILSSKFHRQDVIEDFRRNEIHALSHYVPLHTSTAGAKYGLTHGSLVNTDRIANQIIRLPLWAGISKDQQVRVVEILQKLL
jgi:dTDP-4-amino-4,6-dideoxygalactose transaminase